MRGRNEQDGRVLIVATPVRLNGSGRLDVRPTHAGWRKTNLSAISAGRRQPTVDSETSIATRCTRRRVCYIRRVGTVGSRLPGKRGLMPNRAPRRNFFPERRSPKDPHARIARESRPNTRMSSVSARAHPSRRYCRLTPTDRTNREARRESECRFERSSLGTKDLPTRCSMISRNANPSPRPMRRPSGLPSLDQCPNPRPEQRSDRPTRSARCFGSPACMHSAGSPACAECGQSSMQNGNYPSAGKRRE